MGGGSPGIRATLAEGWRECARTVLCRVRIVREAVHGIDDAVGGVVAAYDNKSLGLIDNWLRNIQDTYHRHRDEIEVLPSRKARVDRLCELNVMAQVRRVAQNPLVQNAWQRGQLLSIHGWIYSIRDGLLQDLQVRINGPDQVDPIYRFAD